MPAKKNPLKLNKLQLRTLVLLQVMGRDTHHAMEQADGSVVIPNLPHAHGDHLHVGEFVVSAKDASGLSNPSVWAALARKGLVANANIPPIVLTPEGQNYETGLAQHFMSKSDH